MRNGRLNAIKPRHEIVIDTEAKVVHPVHSTVQGGVGDTDAAFDAPPQKGIKVLIADPSIGPSEVHSVEASWHAVDAEGRSNIGFGSAQSLRRDRCPPRSSVEA